MTEQTEPDEIEVTVAINAVIEALKKNDTYGIDDRVIECPQRDGANANIRPTFTGSERYSNPSIAPVRVRPENLVEEGWESPPTRPQTADALVDFPEHEDRTTKDKEVLAEQHGNAIQHWEMDARSMIEGEHRFEDTKVGTLVIISVNGRDN